MSFNLRLDTPRDGPNRWARRRDAVARVVHGAMPHALATQEGLGHQLADLDARLPWMRRVGTCRQGDGSDEHNAIFYDARRLLLVAWGDLWLSETPELPASRSWGNRLPRMATWARFTDQESGTSFTLVSTHLDHESAASRVRMAALLDARFPDAIIAGDFNEAPGAPAYVTLTRTRRDAHADEVRGTFHGFTGAPSDVGRIDWILAPRAMARIGGGLLTERVDGRWPSDHFPVWVDLAPAPLVRQSPDGGAAPSSATAA